MPRLPWIAMPALLFAALQVGAPDLANASPRVSRAQPSMAKRATAAWRRVKSEVAAGKPVSATKLPEARATLEWMADRLDARAQELDQKRSNKPFDKKERQYIHALRKQARRLLREGVPYGSYLRFTAYHFTTAMDLASPEHRKSVSVDRLDPKLRTPRGKSPDQRLMIRRMERLLRKNPGKVFYFPTHEHHGLSPFNRLLPYPVNPIAVSDRPENIHGKVRAPSMVALHDFGHAFVRTQPESDAQIAAGERLTAAYNAKLKSTESRAVRDIMRRTWFRLFHEGTFDDRPEYSSRQLTSKLKSLDRPTLKWELRRYGIGDGGHPREAYDQALKLLRELATEHAAAEAARNDR